MSKEKLKILEMIAQGIITAEDGLDLLDAIEGSTETKNTKKTTNISNRFLRIKVSGSTSIKKVDVNIPLGLVQVASNLVKFIPKEAQNQLKEKGIDLATIDFDEIVNMINEGLTDGKIVDVDINDEEEGEMKVEIYVD
ncbi:hypothetical protein GC105_13330 [Alkalibaculum sp. M08DMB]|uniref:YvlB/LiaX N-terminal domain-containing protein n=1 Tax=Alkalibaculum sporogenes TaxID=2655001 RepID=A0A6A7KB68_9FIRM|nr:hypothetical protein [Alkalibaculum sporogenes]MPW26768.1 hypothetical protein [Alkalibaculum sporogenes]